MKTLFAYFLLSTPVTVFAQADLGIGIIAITCDSNAILNLYTSPSDAAPAKSIELYNDISINSVSIRNIDKAKDWLNPEALWLEYSFFFFRCKQNKGDWFEVIANNETRVSFWLKRNEWTTFVSWDSYLKNTFMISRLSSQPQKIRLLPSDNAREIEYSGKDCFQVKSVKGDWIEIFTPAYCEQGYTDSKIKFESGWIKWRSHEKLLIEYFLTS
jgi:hypothetical protein